VQRKEASSLSFIFESVSSQVLVPQTACTSETAGHVEAKDGARSERVSDPKAKRGAGRAGVFIRIHDNRLAETFIAPTEKKSPLCAVKEMARERTSQPDTNL
jgi:hypothetical protein